MIGERLFKMRKERKMNQEELADILSLSKYSISLYENNKSSPSMETLCKIARAFDVSADYLVGLVDEPYSYKRDAETVVRIPAGISPAAKELTNNFINFLYENYSGLK